MTSPVTRRRALAGAATVGVGVPLLAACGDDGSSTATDPSPSPTSSAPEPSATTTAPSGDAGSAEAPAADGLVATADVPVGGGVVLQGEELVVTQPSAGEFKAFTAVCTHQGCLVGSVTGGEIVCPCHNSMFDISDGSVLGGPATAALAEVAVSVSGDQVQRA